MRIGACTHAWITGLLVGGLGGCVLPVGKPEPDPAALRAALVRRGFDPGGEPIRWGPPTYRRTRPGTDLPAVVRTVRVDVGEGDRQRTYYTLTDLVPLEVVEPGMLAPIEPAAPVKRSNQY